MVDEYGTVGAKLAFLLDVQPGERVLLVGRRCLAWREDGARTFARCDAAASAREAAASAGAYGLVVWDASSESPGARLAPLASALARVANAHGRLLLLGDNRWSPAGMRRRRGSSAPEAAWSLPGYRRALRGAGFRGIRSYLAMPYLAAWEEAVASGEERPELASYTPWVLRAANRIGLHRWLHDGYVVAAGREGCPLAALEARLAAALGATMPRARVVVTRFGLRSRGALVLTLRDRVSKVGMLARVAVTPELDRTIAINATRLAELSAESRVPVEVRACLPRLIASTSVGARRLYVEQRIEGHLAWQLVRRASVRARVEEGALRFINGLARGTLHAMDADGPLLDELLERGVANDFAEAPARARGLGLEVARSLGRLLAGRRVPVVVGHGDFGYGNLIVGPGGQLRGVIDWDCSWRRELWGVDWCNHLLQIRRSATGGRLGEAARGVAGRVDAAASALWLEGFTALERADLLRTAFLIACLRYVTRAARYPGEFLADADDYLDVLTWLRDQTAA